MRWVRPFLRLLGVSRLSVLGAALVTSAFIGDVILIAGEILTFVSNPYIGIVAYMVMPGLMAAGLGLIPVGIYLRLRRLRHPLSLRTLQRLAATGVLHEPAAIARTVTLLTLINLVAFAVIGYRGYHYMDSTEFCGEVCHEVMAPEFTVYQHSPHAEVECVECHIGPGAGWFVRSKISGARQVLAVMLDTYEKPIHTPIANLRPAREVCEVCHRPELFHGNLIRTIEHFKPDEHNTPTYTVLNMRVGGGGDDYLHATGIHWHTSKDHTLRYYATDPKREHIVLVELTEADGTRTVWTRPGHDVDPDTVPRDRLRTMDCIDCHNRPTHIYLPPDRAIEQALARNQLDPSLPWIRAVAEEVLTVDYPTREDAMAGIERHTLAIYRQRHPDVWARREADVRAAVRGLQDIHRLYVWPQMDITWNTYPSLIGHADAHSQRCFRCHDGELRTAEGRTITIDCQACHYILARDSEDPQVLRVLQGLPTFYEGTHD